jgi:2'-5' RNA ligase
MSGEVEPALSPAERYRVFVAVALPDEVRDRVATHIASLRKSVPDARASWARPDALHITLKFLGDVDRVRIDKLVEVVSRASAGLERFSLAIEGAGSFPPRGPARVLWLGIEDLSGKLAELQQRLEDECYSNGFPREARLFHPHLTVARIRNPAWAKELAAAHCGLGFSRVEFEVDRVVVMRSELGSSGSRYTELASATMSDNS